MKAADVLKKAQDQAQRKPPHTFMLPPSAFTEKWVDRPRANVRVGMRRASADEYLIVRANAMRKADELHPPLVERHDHPVWLETYDVVMFHYLLGYVLTHPDDVLAPFFPHIQSGDMMFAAAKTSALGTEIASIRFTKEGMDRIFLELEVLSLKDSPVRREASDDEIAEMAAQIAEGTFFSTVVVPPPPRGVDARDDARERRAVYERQLRKMLAYVIDIHATGYEVSAAK